MTRVNLIPVEELYDQHLVAEYRELLMIPAALKRSLRSKNFNEDKLPKKFTLNTGHVKFFYKRGLFLQKRYAMLIEEMRKRGMNPDPNRVFPLDVFPEDYQNDWVANEEDINISRCRINFRVSQKLKWYRKTTYQRNY